MLLNFIYLSLFEIIKPLYCVNNKAVLLYFVSKCVTVYCFPCSISCNITGSLVVIKSAP